MSAPENSGDRDGMKSTSWMDVLTGRIGKAAALVAALAALAAGLANLAGLFNIMPKAPPKPPPAPPALSAGQSPAPPPQERVAATADSNCLTVDEPRFPDRLVYSNGEWEQEPRIKLSGRNDCNPNVGLFLIVTSTRTGLYMLEPRGVTAVCEKPSVNKMDCWEFKIPVDLGKNWTWEARFPAGTPNNDKRRVGRISVNYEVRRTDLPETILRGGAGPSIAVVENGG